MDPNNAGQIKEKTDTEACMRRAESAKELLSQVKARFFLFTVIGWLFFRAFFFYSSRFYVKMELRLLMLLLLLLFSCHDEEAVDEEAVE